MCQRYVLPDPVAAEHEFVPGTAWWKFAPKFNVAPTQYVPAIRLHERQTEGVMLRWGFIPQWFEGEPTAPPLTHVRSERVAGSKIYATAWRSGRRCILPAAGFYTWQLTRERYRQPYFVRLNNRAVFGIAAVWDRWVSEDDDVIESCAILGVPPNSLMANLDETQRGMPAILRRRDYALWLEGDVAEAHAALRPYNESWMRAHAVSPRINSRAVDDAALTLEVE